MVSSVWTGARLIVDLTHRRLVIVLPVSKTHLVGTPNLDRPKKGLIRFDGRLLVLVMPPDGGYCGGQLRMCGTEVPSCRMQMAVLYQPSIYWETARRSPALVGRAAVSMSSRLRMARNDSAMALTSQHSSLHPTESTTPLAGARGPVRRSRHSCTGLTTPVGLENDTQLRCPVGESHDEGVGDQSVRM
jgi:hypothetical protein